MFIKLENGQPVGNAVIQANMEYLFPQFNFNQILTPAMVEPLGFGIFEFTQIPEPDRYKKIVEGQPIRSDSNGIYYQNWQSIDMTALEQADSDNKKAEIVRAERNNLLRMTDWTQLADVTLSPEKRDEYIAYRQELRDITATQGFPWQIIWPIPPA
jgi:hypothetical protein